MSLPTSPLTRQPAEHKVPNSIYLEDESGLWFDPDRIDVQVPGQTARPSSAAEQQADEQLATALHKRYVKKPGRMLDMYSETTSLVEKFEGLGYTAHATTNGKSWEASTKFDLITFVHTFQRIAARLVVEQLKQASDRLAPGGYIYIRMPDHEVAGYERDLNADLMKRTPCMWSLGSFLELLAQIGTLKIVETYDLKPGQRDYFLQRLERKPRICAGMIVKNEERDLPKCLESIKDVVDGICVIDTGSKDQTMKIAQDWIRDTKAFRLTPKFRGHVSQYLGASEPDDKGDWKLWDFGKARNQFVEQIEAMGDFDYVLWMDADDILLTPRQLANLVYLEQPVIQGIQMISGDIKWTHHRLWKTKRGIKFHGRCHEYPAWAGPDLNHTHVKIFHDAAPGAGENANARNLRILDREVKEAPTPRNTFYLANTHKDGGRWAEAIPFYEKRMQFGKGYEEEYWFAALYKSRCLRSVRRHKDAEKFLFECLKDRFDWSEFWMELAYLEHDLGNAARCLGYCLAAADRPQPPSNLFREPNKYTDQPYRYASFSAEKMGDRDLAIIYAIKAKEKIGSPDASWESRIKTLKSKYEYPSIPEPNELQSKTKKVCWLRPGAIGDVLMTLNLIKPFKLQNPDTEIVYQTHPSTSQHLRDTMLEAGVDCVISTDDRHTLTTYNLVGYPLAEGYPEKPMGDHLVRYFAKELGIQKLQDTDLFYNLSLRAPTRLFKDRYCTIHTQAGWSPYKNWPMDRWQQIAERLMERGIAVVQIGGPGDARIKGAEHMLLGKPLKENLGAMAWADFHLGIDSWSNHATNIIWSPKCDRTKAVILWGSTQAAAAGYATNRNVNLGLPCQPCFREDPKISAMSRGVCPNPAGQVFENPQHACMAGISVDRVWAEVEFLLNK